MAEGFVLNIPQEMLNRLQKADEKIEKLDKASRRVGENIRLAFEQGAKGVDKFIGSLNSAQKILDGFKDKKINVGLNLDSKAVTDLKKQLENLGVKIPVGVTATGGGSGSSGGSSGGNAGGSNLANLIAKIDTINNTLNQILTHTTAISNKMDSRGGGMGGSTGGTRQTPYTQKQLESLNKNSRNALYREELNAIQRLTNAEKEKARIERENDKKNQIAHRQRMVELQQQEREIRRLAASYRNLPTSIDTKSAGGLIARSKDAKTINQRITAIKNLKNAIKDLDTTDSRYQRTVNHLNKEIRRQEQELAKLGHKMNDVSRRSQNLFNISQQLGRALSLMFSVSQIGQYVSKMVNVRKEMELQQRSLQVLLQSKDKANELWNQTLDLAVKSPFRVKELVTYTKQLAAYRIESDKLFETNKMLADVSAGLGVDMQRLILAFGQVKSASFLRGTELRQFTEAGIPMLEELSKYFSEIYGKSISVAEVFDMISKRMVTFTDVEAVFQRMTGSGGVFFNMQEELSQTTAGMISNLQDSIDLMLNDMGKKNQGIINTTIKFMKWLVDRWKGVSQVMKGILFILSGYIGATAKWGNMAKNVGNIFTSIFSGAGLLSMGITVAIALLVKLGVEAVRYNKTLKNIHKEHEKFRDSLNDIELGFAELYRNGVDDIDEYKGKLQELMSIAKQSYNIDMDFQINNLDSIDEVARKFDELKEKILSFDNLSLEFDIDFAEQSDRGWELFQDYLEKDLNQLAARQSDIKKLASDLRGELTRQIKNVAEFQRLEEELSLSSSNAKILEEEYWKLVGEGKIYEAEPIYKAMESANEQTRELQKRIIELKEELGSANIDIVSSLFPRGVDESEYEYLQRIAKAITDIYNESKNFDKKIYGSSEDYIAKMFGVDMQSATSIYKKISDIASKYNKDLTQATKELNDFLAKTQTEVANLVNTSLRYEVNVSGLLDEIEKSYFSGNDTLEQTASKVLQGKGYTLTEEFYELLEKYVDRAIYSKDEVNGVFANLSDIIENQYLSKEVSSYVYGGLKNLASEKEWDETLFHEILSQAEEYYQNALKDDEGNLVLEGLKLDLIPEKEKSSEIELKEWQKAYNEEVDDIMDYLDADGDSIFMPLKIRADVQGVATTKEKQLDVLNQAIDDAQKKINNFKIANTYLTQEIDELNKALGGEQLDIDTRNEYEDKLERYNKLWNENVEKQEMYVEYLIHLRNLLGGDDDKEKKGGNKKNKIIQEQIALIKTLYDEYQKLSKEMTSEDSKRNILDRFSDYAKELKIDIEKIDFTNLQGVIEAYESLKSRAKAAGNEVYREFLKTFSETTVEIELMYHIKERERITNEIQELFSDYEMTVDLKKIDIPRNLAEDLFDVDWTELSDVKERLDKEKNILVNQNKEIEKEVSDRYSKDVNDTVLESLKAQAKGNKERIAIIDKFLGQWNELEKKASEERIKTYYKYLLEEQHEQVKIRLETLKKLNEVDAEDKFTKEQKITIKTKIREEQDEKMAQQRWKDFETSPMYLSLFEDIDSMSNGALEQMIDTMDKLKGQLIEMGLPASDLKQILNQIDRVEEELEKRQPFKNFADNAKTAFKRSKELLELEQKRAIQQKKYDNAKSMYDLYQNSLAHAQTTLDNTEFEKGSIEYTALETSVNNLLRSTNKWAKEVEKAEGDLSNTNTAIVEVNQSSMDFYNQLKDVGTITKSVSGGMWDIVGAIHGIPEETKETLDYLGKLEQGVANIVGGILRIIYEDKIAGIAQLVDGLFSTVALIIDWTSGVRKANKEIERQRRILSNLTNEYERLNKELDKAWNVDNIRDYNSEMKRNLEEQIEYQKKIVATYEDMKGADKEGSVEWERVKDAEQELHNLYEQQEEMRNNMVSKLTGIAVDDVVSAAESWVDAWYEAFKETGDGLKGLEDNFNEVILNMVKRQASMKIAGKFIDEWNDALDRYVKDGYLGNSEMESYFYKVKNDLPALSSQLETFFASFDNILGDTSGNLSTLQRGISSITEQQADILASYLNSIRFIVMDSNSQLKALLAVQSNANSNTNNPILEQIRIIARNTQMLYDFFSGMTASWNGNGRGLKVVL